MFKVEQDSAGFAVTRQEIQQLIDVNVQAVAEGNEIGKAHLTLLRPVEDGIGYRSRLRNKGQFAFTDRNRGKTGIQPLPGRKQTEAIWTKNAHLVAAGAGQQFGLLFRRRGKNNAGFTAFLTERLKQFEVSFRMRTEHGEVGNKR